MVKRTVLRSSAGKKLYAVRDKSGKFKDIQSYARAHAQDIKRGTTRTEAVKRAKRKKTAKKAAPKKAASKKTASKKTAVKRVRKPAKKSAKKK